jgi:hypothetical protein
MGYRGRIYFTEKQKAEIWDRWQRGESMSSIGRMFDRNLSSIYPLLSRTGGIRPPERKRSRLALRLSEREEISRGLEGVAVSSNDCPSVATCAIDDQPRGAAQWRPHRLSGCAIGSGGLGSHTSPQAVQVRLSPGAVPDSIG